MKTNHRPISSATTSDPIPHGLVAERAYAIWLARGRPEGRDYDHWVQAERQLSLAIPEGDVESLSSRMAHWDDPLSTDIERALDSIASPSGQRSATSL